MNSSLGSLFRSILDAVKNEALKIVLPLVQKFLADVAANPTQLNIVAKLGQLQVDLLAALPDLESSLAKDLSVILNNEIAALVAQQAQPSKAVAAV